MSTKQAFKVYIVSLIAFYNTHAVKVKIESDTPFAPPSLDIEIKSQESKNKPISTKKSNIEQETQPPVQEDIKTEDTAPKLPEKEITTTDIEHRKQEIKKELTQPKKLENINDTTSNKENEKIPQKDQKSEFATDEFQKEKRLKEIEKSINVEIIKKQKTKSKDTTDTQKENEKAMYDITDNQKKWLKSDIQKPIPNRRKYFDNYVVPPNIIQKNNNGLNEQLPTPIFEHEIYGYIMQLINNPTKENVNKIKATMPKLETKNIVDKHGNSLLMYAVNQKNSDMVAFMLSQGVSPFLRNNKGTSPIHLAVFLKHANIIRTLCAIEDVANIPDKNGNTPLMYALFQDEKELVRLLLENGADPMIENDARENAYYIANYLKKDDWLD